MKIELKMRGLDRTAGLRDFVGQELKDLQRDVSIECARIVLEQKTDEAPACHTSVWLVVPGPDLRAAACDHTILAAWKKTRADLVRQIRDRKSRRITRQKSNLKVRGVARRRP